MQATGTLEVKIAPQKPDNAPAESSGVSRMSIDKVFHGALEGTSKGEMLAYGSTAGNGSAGYVAMERVTGTLDGKHGSFVLQHTATMDRGAPSLSVTVVPDSGTDELVGLKGKMSIEVAAGKHSYTFEYELVK